MPSLNRLYMLSSLQSLIGFKDREYLFSEENIQFNLYEQKSGLMQKLSTGQWRIKVSEEVAHE